MNFKRLPFDCFHQPLISMLRTLSRPVQFVLPMVSEGVWSIDSNNHHANEYHLGWNYSIEMVTSNIAYYANYFRISYFLLNQLKARRGLDLFPIVGYENQNKTKFCC